MPCASWSSRAIVTCSLLRVRAGRARSTEKGKFLHIIRKVFVRVSTKMDWFVFKLH